MDIIHNIYFTFFSIGSLIPVVFHLLITFFFFTIPGKSRATFHIAMGYLLMTIFNFAYLISSSVYHPAAAYHRWITVGVILLGEAHFNLFMFHYGSEGNPRTGRIFLAIQYVLSLAITAVFCRVTLGARKVFHFDGHYWDFDADRISTVIAMVIIAYILVFIALLVYKWVKLRGRERWIALLMGLTYCAATIVPSLTNTFSREGRLDREIFQITWALFNLFGFFLLAIVYINNTREKTNFLAKVMGISMVTLLVLLQGLSYVSSGDMDRAYDEARRLETGRMLAAPEYRSPDLVYLAVHSLEALRPDRSLSKGIPHADPSTGDRLAAARSIHRLYELRECDHAAARKILGSAPPSFAGYGNSILAFIDAAPGKKASKAEIERLLARLQGEVLYFARKTAKLPAEKFREKLSAIMASKPSLVHFRNAIEARAAALEGDPGALRTAALELLAPVPMPGSRRYLERGGAHAVAFIHVDPQRNLIGEAAFDYRTYRRIAHSPSVKLTVMTFVLVVFVLAGFRLFFLGTFVYPLRRLLAGVREVNAGNLGVSVPVKTGDEIGFLADSFNRMVVSIKKSSDDLNETRLYLKNIIDSMPSVLIGVDPEGRVTHWNLEAERLTKTSEAQAQGIHISQLIPQFSRHMEGLRQTIRDRNPYKVEKVTYQQNGETRYSDVVVYPLIANGVRGAVIRVDDITERVRFEEMMIQSEKMASVGGLAAGMAHEINNPLGGIMLAAQNITRRLSTDLEKNAETARRLGGDIGTIHRYMEEREVVKMLHGIMEMGERASKIVSNMLNFSRRSESKMAPADISEVMANTLDLASNDYNLKKKYDFRHIEIVTDYDDGIPRVCCIVTEIQQVILNLLKNAAQAMSGKEYRDGGPRIIIRIKKEPECVRIEMEDNGPGIDEKLRKRIFEPFFTTKGAGVGTGLGLSVSYFIIQNDHRGTMTVESVPGQWTRFIIRLPYGKCDEGGGKVAENVRAD